MKAMTDYTREENENALANKLPFHWVMVTNHVQIKHMADTDEFNIGKNVLKFLNL